VVVPKWIDRLGAQGVAPRCLFCGFVLLLRFLGWFKSKLIEVLGFLNLKVFCYVN